MATKKERSPRQTTIDGVFEAVKDKAGMDRKSIASVTRKTPYTVGLCLKVLVASRKVRKLFIRASGPYEVFHYEVTNFN